MFRVLQMLLFHFRLLHHWHESMLDPGWILGLWFLSLCPHLWSLKDQCQGSEEVSKTWAALHRICTARRTHYPELLFGESLTSSAAEYLIWEGQVLAGGFRRPCSSEPCLGWAGRGGCSLFIPSTVLSSKHFRASSSSRQSLINCQPTGVIWGLNHHFSNLLLLW